MIKGLLSGGFWGLVLGVTSLAGVSLVAEQPAGNTPPDTPQIAAPQTAQGATIVDTAPQDLTQPNTDAEAVSASAAEVPLPGSASQTPQADDVLGDLIDTAPAAQPATADVAEALTVPTAGATPQIAADTEQPVLPNPQSVAPQIPVAEDDLIVSTQPAVPVVPVVEAPVADISDAADVAVVDVPDAPVIVVEDAPDPVLDANVDAPQSIPDVVVDPVETEPATVPDATEVATQMTAPASDIVPQPDALPATEEPVEAGVVDPTLPTAPVAPAGDDAPVRIDTAQSVVPPAIPDVSEADAQSDADTPSSADAPPPTVVTIIEGTTPRMPTGAGNVRVNRIGTGEDRATAPDVAEDVTSPAIPDDAPAILRYAAPFENPQDAPVLSIMLLDDGTFSDAVTAVASLPFPVTVMLNPASPDAAVKIAAYRALGIEVGVTATLPDGATPADVEVFLEAAFATLPETVAILDAGETGLQANAAVTDQVVAALAEDGRGLITSSSGLNPGLRAAQKADVPASVIYRDLDAEGQDARVIRRFLDQAAFRARQDSGVILLGRVRADTISALILWGTANRAGQVALAPVSAALTLP